MTKIALILSGGGSLGTYTAGAVTELLRGLAGNRSGATVQVGALAGASSGALTAALAARALVVNPTLVPWIGEAWIRGMDAGVLLDTNRSRSSLLDAEALEQMSRALITADPASDDEPSSIVGEPLGLGITLSCLHGIPYELRYGFLNRPDRSFGTRVFDDWAAFELRAADSAGAPVWEEIRQAAVASASFPFAFPPRRLERRGSHFRGSALEDFGDIDLWYTDGGLFNNEPVRLAKRLVARAGGEGDDWRFIFVDPTLRDPAGDEFSTSTAPGSAVQVASLVARALLGQGSAKDWIRANRTNERLAILDSLVDRLPEIADSLTDPDAFELGRSVGEMAESVCEWRLVCGKGGRGGRPRGSGAAEGSDPVMQLLDESLERIERRYSNVLARVSSRAARSRLAKLIFLIEAAGGLDDKEELPLYLIAPGRRLAGDFLGNFGGLFSEAWREADYRAGRRDARRLLETSLADIVEYEPGEDAEYEVSEMVGSIDALEPRQRRRLESLIEREVDRSIAEMDTGFLGGLFGFAWKPALRRWATARAIESLRSS
jgi:predicted acylesterase/phospholipase RssA